MQSWLEGRIWVGKGAQATGMTASLRIQSSKADSNTWESFTRSGLKLESVHQESPRSDVFRKRATKPLLNQRQRQKHLTWAVEKKNWTVAQWSKVLFSDERNLAFHLEIKVPESGGGVERHRIHVAWSPHVQGELIWRQRVHGCSSELCKYTYRTSYRNDNCKDLPKSETVGGQNNPWCG